MVQTIRSSRAGGTVERNQPQKGGVQLRADGPGRWFDCQMDWSPSVQVFKWVIRTGRSQTQAHWCQEQQDFPFRLGSLRAEMGACQLTNTST